MITPKVSGRFEGDYDLFVTRYGDSRVITGQFVRRGIASKEMEVFFDRYPYLKIFAKYDSIDCNVETCRRLGDIISLVATEQADLNRSLLNLFDDTEN